MNKVTYNSVSEIPRPKWDEMFMAMACLYATRSPDPSTKHGCVIVKDNIIVGCGYNGFPKGGKDDSIYPTTRPEKYKFLSHSEPNALSNRTINESGCTAYVTGKPCSGCVLRMIQDGVKMVIYGDVGSDMVDDSDWQSSLVMANNCGLKFHEYSKMIYDPLQPNEVMSIAQEYLILKGWTE